MKMFGWSGIILDVDLTKEKIVRRNLNKAFAKLFLGGRGFNSKIIYDEFDPTICDPYDPENLLCISPGLLSGSLAPSSSRVEISVARSPITMVFSDGNAGGFFGPELRHAGYDAIVIRGRHKKLSYLLIIDDDVQIRDATHLRGMTTWETDEAIKEEIGDPEVQILAIGPAGENLVASAAPACNLARVPGPAGSGAVMGSKNLKAIAVRGTKGIKVAKPDEFEKACFEAFDQILSHPLYKNWSIYGTSMLVGTKAAIDELPVKNWQYTTFPNYELTDGPYLYEHYMLKNKGCFNCPVHCSRYYIVREGSFATYGEGPEYEAQDTFGARAGNTNPESILYMNTLVNQLGLDVLQAGNAICTSMHWWQDGLIDQNDTGGLILEWGNVDAMIELLKQIAFKRGFGALFADGVVPAAKKIAAKKGLPEEKLIYYIIQGKGMTQVGSEELRGHIGVALSFATSTRGFDHLRGMPTIEIYYEQWYKGKEPEKVANELGIPLETLTDWFNHDLLRKGRYEGKEYVVKYYQDHCAVGDALGICRFITSWRLGVGPILMAKMVSAATGIDYTWQDIQKVGERIWTVEYAIQRRYGLRRKDDFLPERCYKEPIPDGMDKGAFIDKEKYEKLLIAYYKLRGYDEEGIPTKEKLLELGLEDIAQDMENLHRTN